jgi:hypothetical protein
MRTERILITGFYISYGLAIVGFAICFWLFRDRLTSVMRIVLLFAILALAIIVFRRPILYRKNIRIPIWGGYLLSGLLLLISIFAAFISFWGVFLRYTGNIGMLANALFWTGTSVALSCLLTLLIASWTYWREKKYQSRVTTN